MAPPLSAQRLAGFALSERRARRPHAVSGESFDSTYVPGPTAGGRYLPTSREPPNISWACVSNHSAEASGPQQKCNRLSTNTPLAPPTPARPAPLSPLPDHSAPCRLNISGEKDTRTSSGRYKKPPRMLQPNVNRLLPPGPWSTNDPAQDRDTPQRSRPHPSQASGQSLRSDRAHSSTTNPPFTRTSQMTI